MADADDEMDRLQAEGVGHLEAKKVVGKVVMETAKSEVFNKITEDYRLEAKTSTMPYCYRHDRQCLQVRTERLINRPQALLKFEVEGCVGGHEDL